LPVNDCARLSPDEIDEQFKARVIQLGADRPMSRCLEQGGEFRRF
jgi:hypothetical protein